MGLSGSNVVISPTRDEVAVDGVKDAALYQKWNILPTRRIYSFYAVFRVFTFFHRSVGILSL